MRPLRIALLSFYFPPDISAGAFRAQALVDALMKIMQPGSELHVITTMPNRFPDKQQYVNKVDADTTAGMCTVTRFSVMGGGRGMASQAMAFINYSAKVKKLVSGKEYDLVIASSSRLMTAVLGRWLAKPNRTFLYQDIRDNFVDNLPYILPLGLGSLLAPIFGSLERWALKSADRVNLVSRGFCPYFGQRYPSKDFSFHTNGIDQPFVVSALRGDFETKLPMHAEGPLKVLYAGNLGKGQAIECIIPLLAERLKDKVSFEVIGSGPGHEALCRKLTERGIKNVNVRGALPRDEMIEAYSGCDILFLHLNRLPSLECVLPSKLFEYAATGRPLWAGVSGYPADFIGNEVENSACFTPCDVESAIDALHRLEVSYRPRHAFINRWGRSAIMLNMAEDIMDLVKDGE